MFLLQRLAAQTESHFVAISVCVSFSFDGYWHAPIVAAPQGRELPRGHLVTRASAHAAGMPL